VPIWIFHDIRKVSFRALQWCVMHLVWTITCVLRPLQRLELTCPPTSLRGAPLVKRWACSSAFFIHFGRFPFVGGCTILQPTLLVYTILPSSFMPSSVDSDVHPNKLHKWLAKWLIYSWSFPSSSGWSITFRNLHAPSDLVCKWLWLDTKLLLVV